MQKKTAEISNRLDLGAEGKGEIKVDSNFEPEQLKGNLGRGSSLRMGNQEFLSESVTFEMYKQSGQENNCKFLSVAQRRD